MATVIDFRAGACRQQAGFDCLVDGTDDYPAVCVGDDGRYFSVDSQGITMISAEIALAAWDEADIEDRLPDEHPAVLAMLNDMKYGEKGR